MRRVWVCAIVIALGGLAGCLGDEEDPGAADVEAAEVETTDDTDDLEQISLEGQSCEMGGGQSVHPREMALVGNVSEIVPEPWRVADVLEDTGEQYTYSQWPKPSAPKPQEGDTWGHYHATIVCESWTLDGESKDELVFGFVGPKVKSPDFADDAADDTYLTTVIGTNDEQLYERLQRGGVDAMHTDATFERTDETARIAMNTDHNGNYLSVYGLNELGPLEDEHVRLWFQQENLDGTYTPIAMELTREGGTHYGDLGEGYFHHEQTAHHWPLPGAYGHTAAAHYDGFDVSLSWGPSPDVALEDEYVH